MEEEKKKPFTNVFQKLKNILRRMSKKKRAEDEAAKLAAEEEQRKAEEAAKLAAEEEQKKKSVLKRLQEPVPVPEGAKPVTGCVLCGDRERI